MMKQIGVILLALCMFSATVFATQEFNPTVDEQRDEEQMDIAYETYLTENVDLATLANCNDCTDSDARIRTQISASLEVIGEVADDGDTFVARTSVTNVGTEPAYYVLGYLSADVLEGLPEGWIVENNDGKNFVVWDKIMPGETKGFDFIVTRDEQDATILFKAFGKNCIKATSERVKVPVNPLILGGIAASMFGMYAVSRRKEEFV